jgi:hypothetical protein
MSRFGDEGENIRGGRVDHDLACALGMTALSGEP